MKILIICLILFLMNIASFSNEIFIVSDVYSIRPDGKCNELKNGKFGELKSANTNWNASSQQIKLYAAKNEEVAVQIVMNGAGKNYSLKMSDLTGADKISAKQCSFSLIAWVQNQKWGYCPDLVIPLDGSVNKIKSFDIPLSLTGIPSTQNKVGVVLFEIWIPKSVSAGKYHGLLKILQNDSDLMDLNVELVVFDFQLPDKPTFDFELLSYGLPHEDFHKKCRINVKDGLNKKAEKIPDECKQIDYQIYNLAADHRCYINSILYSSQRGSPRYAYPVAGKGINAHIMSFEEWDNFFAPVLDGKLNKYNQPPANFMLPFNINYPYICESEPQLQFDFRPFKYNIPNGPGRIKDLREFEISFKQIAQQYQIHFSEKGWTRTTYQIYFNQKPNKDRNRTPWKLDEPTAELDYLGLRYLFNVADWAFTPTEKSKINIANRLDIGHFNCDKFRTPNNTPTRCYKRKDFNSGNADGYLKNAVDHWVIGSSHIAAAEHTLPEYRSPGKKIFNYSTSGASDAMGFHYGQFAGEGFIAARLGINGRVIFKIDLERADPNNVQGKDFVFYNGSSLGFRGALPSHRLKLWRMAVNSFEYIDRAKKMSPGKVEEFIKQMVKIGPAKSIKYRERSNSKDFWFTNNVEDIMAAKIKLAEIITGQKVIDIKISGDSEKYNPCGIADKIIGYD